jgi:hypothetical protein
MKSPGQVPLRPRLSQAYEVLSARLLRPKDRRVSNKKPQPPPWPGLSQTRFAMCGGNHTTPIQPNAHRASTLKTAALPCAPAAGQSQFNPLSSEEAIIASMMETLWLVAIGMGCWAVGNATVFAMFALRTGGTSVAEPQRCRGGPCQADA